MSAIIDTLITTLEAAPDNWQCRQALVEALVAENRVDEAYALMNQVAELPADVDSLIMAAKAYGALEPSSGIEILDQVIASDPANAAASYEKAVLCLAAGDVEQANLHYTAATSLDPSLIDPDFVVRMASAPKAKASPPSPPPRQAPATPPADQAPVAVQPTPLKPPGSEASEEPTQHAEVAYPAPGEFPVVTLAESLEQTHSDPLVDPQAVPPAPHLSFNENPQHTGTVHTSRQEYIEHVHDVSVYPAPHPEGIAYDYQHPDTTMFEPTITDDEIYVGALVTDTGVPVAGLQEAIRHHKEQKAAEIAQREKREKVQSVIVGIVTMTLVCVAMAFAVANAPRPNPPQIVASAVGPPTDENMEVKTMIKQTTPTTQPSSASMSMDMITASSASNISMMSFDSPTVDLGSSSMGMDFGSSMNFGDGAGGGSVMFFGGKSSGKRFLFILDASASMKPHQIKLRDDELEKTLKTLRNVDYHVLLFASGSYFAEKGWSVDLKNKAGGRGHCHFEAPWGKYSFKEEGGLHSYSLIDEKGFKPAKWMKASASSVRKTVKFVRESQKFVGTDWDCAIKVGCMMEPPPDVIFFMSDGADSKLDVDEVIRNSKKRGRPKINCIAMQTQTGAEKFAAIAKGSKGTFTIVDGDGEPIDGFEYLKDPGSFAARLK